MGAVSRTGARRVKSGASRLAGTPRARLGPGSLLVAGAQCEARTLIDDTAGYDEWLGYVLHAEGDLALVSSSGRRAPAGAGPSPRSTSAPGWGWRRRAAG